MPPPPPKKEKRPLPHIGYVAISRAKTDEPDDETGFESIILAHPLLPSDFMIPEIRKQLINGEYERLRNLEETAAMNPNEDLEIKFNSINTVRVGFSVPNMRGDKRRTHNTTPFIVFTETEEALIRNAYRRGRNDQIVANNYGIPIPKTTLRCLAKQNWIEDDIINYIFSIWNERATLEDSRNLFVCTFFMDRLRGDGSYNFDNVRNFFNDGLDVKEDSVIYIPVNVKNMHWTLLVVNMLDKTIKYYDGLRGKKLI